jgi:putative hemolysin
MNIAFNTTRYLARVAKHAADIAACQALRYRCFYGGVGRDMDRFDALCDHVMIHDTQTDQLVCTFRMMRLKNGHDIDLSYASQSYDLKGLRKFTGSILEIGRFCTDPSVTDPDVLRVAWAALTQIVDAEGIQMLFGCASFAGTDPAEYAAGFAVLSQRHLGPAHLRPQKRAEQTICLSDFTSTANAKEGVAQLPPLLKTYLGMGGWVSDHAVIDRDLSTMHVFTGLFIADVPPARAKALRRLARFA